MISQSGWCGGLAQCSLQCSQCPEWQIIENLNILAKTVGSPYNCREPWQLKRKPPVRLEPRFVSGDVERVQLLVMSPHFSLQVIAADGEQKAARALKEASETIAESSSAMQLRYLQVREISGEILPHPAAPILFSRLSTLSAQRRITRLSSRSRLTLLVTWWVVAGEEGNIRHLPVLSPLLRGRKSLSEGNKQRSRVETFLLLNGFLVSKDIICFM